jgi:IclR family acetate operon transcriptional repressor
MADGNTRWCRIFNANDEIMAELTPEPVSAADQSPTGRREKGSSITRVLEIIEAVSQSDSPPGPADLALKLDIPRASIHRLIKQLIGEDFLQLDPRGLLLPGDRLHKLTLGVLYSNRHKALRHTILENLAHRIGETCGIAIPDGTQMTYIDRVQTNWPLQINLPVGAHVPLWCTATGKLYLGSLDELTRSRMLQHLKLDRMSRNTITGVSALSTALEQVRENDMGTDDEEFIDGMVGCSVPIRDKRGALIACLFTHAPVIRKSFHELVASEPVLRKAAAELTEVLDPN